MATTELQLAGRAAYAELLRTRHGYMLVPRNDIYVAGALRAYGEYSEAEVALFRDIIQPDWTVVELGANIGALTLPLAALASHGCVLAIEPQRIAYQMLCANLALNSVAHAEALRACAGSSAGIAHVPHLDPYRVNNFGGLDALAFSEGDPVEIVTLDALGLRACHFLKLDIEGGESSALSGAAEVLAKHRPWVYCEFTSNRAELLALLEGHGYTCLRHLPRHNSEPNFFGRPVTDFLASDNLLAMPPGATLTADMVSGAFTQRHNLLRPTTSNVLHQPEDSPN